MMAELYLDQLQLLQKLPNPTISNHILCWAVLLRPANSQDLAPHVGLSPFSYARHYLHERQRDARLTCGLFCL